MTNSGNGNDEQVLVTGAWRWYDKPVFARGWGELRSAAEAAWFCRRFAAETSEDVKQIIPYVVFRSGTKVYVYQRKGGGEGRLEGQWSVGIGGHINPCDGHWGGERVLKAAAKREVEEELTLSHGYRNPVLIGVINDQSTLVGRVHIGAVYFYYLLSESEIAPRDPTVANGHFVEIRDLDLESGSLDLEPWSKILYKEYLLPSATQL